jgi:hypothetical protein
VVNVLANDSDPDGGTLSVTAVGTAANGVTSTNGSTVTYTPAAGFVGGDSFSYTISDGQGGSASSTVSITVTPLGPGCTISISALETQVNWGEQVHVTATASCNTGAPQIEWWHAFPNSGLRLVQAFGSSASFVMTMNDPLLQIGANKFFARARTTGTVNPIATSNTITVTVVDTVASCTAVALTAPANNSSAALGSPVTLSATSTCPAGTTGEYLYFVKRSTDTNWSEIPGGHVPGSIQFTPPTAATWQFQATARSVGSHTRYQVRSAARNVIVN